MLCQYYQVLTKTKLDVILFEDMGAVNNYLLDYVHKQCGRVSKFYTVAMQSFFEDIATENNLDELNDVVKFLGEDLFNAVYPCALEFFYSNVYILDNDQTAWNAMDSFLKKNGMLLKADDKDYLIALRNSYMSIYEVLDFEVDKSITLKNLIEKNKKPITVSEKSLTHQIVKWDKLGLRLVSMKDGKTLIAGGGIPLSNEAAEESIKIIKAVTKELKKLEKK